jgi:PKD domain
MMPSSRTIRPRLLAALAGCLLSAGLLSSAAHADNYGEKLRFPIAAGGFHLSELTDAFGVSPTTNDVFVGAEEGEETGEYRIKEFSSTGTLLGETAVLNPAGKSDGIEGIAVDDSEGRIYVLARLERGEKVSDPDEPAAGILYAFKEQPTGKVLESAVAGGTAEAKEGVLANATTLKTQNNKSEALLNPAGIAVDPTTHDIVLLGEFDKGGELHAALERVTAQGELLAKPYVDPVETEEEEDNSPVVTAAGSVFAQRNSVGHEEEIIKLPVTESSAEPTTVFQFNTDESLGPIEELVEFDSALEPISKGGGATLIAGSGDTGRVFTTAEIKEQVLGDDEVVDENSYLGAVGVGYEDTGTTVKSAEYGWTGARNEQAGEKAKCAITEGGETYPQVAAGSGETLFFLIPATSEVAEFGPGGEGCPHASVPAVPAIEATVNGTTVTEAQTVEPGTKVKLSSLVVQGNALKTEWNFADGETKTVEADQHQITEVEHTFAKEGTFKIVEKVHTDNLATPEVTVERTLQVSPPLPTATLHGPGTATTGQAVTFEGSATPAPGGGAAIAEYHWNFGDGTTETKPSTAKTLTVSHAFAKAGSFAVELTVTDAAKRTSKPAKLVVKVSEPGGGGTTGGGTTGGGTTGGGTTGGGTISGGTTGGGTTGGGTTGGGSTGGGSTGGGTTGVLAYQAGFAASSYTVARNGAVTVKVDCSGKSSCAGTVTLRTITAVSSGAGHKKAILTLASGSFSATAGQVKAITLHLSAKARAMLAHSHVLKARATIVGRDAAGAAHTTQATVTLRAASSKAKH